MFATLNLKLSSLDFSGEMPETPIMTPQSGLEFAGLLQLSALEQSIDPIQRQKPGGEILPQDGSELPLQSIPVTTDMPLPSALQPLDSPTPGVTPGPEREIAADVVVEAQVQYPVADIDLAESVVAPTTVRLPPVPEVVTGEPVPIERVPTVLATAAPAPAAPSPVLTRAAEPTQPTIAPAERAIDVPLPVRREPGAVATQAPLATLDSEAAERLVPVDHPPRRIEPSTPISVVEATPDAPKARPVVNQAVPVLNIQPNPQQPLPIVTPAPTAASDTGYAAAMQQVSDPIPTAVREPAWGEHIGERVLMMAGNQVRTAEIRLTPAELGPLRVQVSVEDGAANVTFQAQHAVTREAIEQALPRLRELLAENGLSLGQANVGEQGIAGRDGDDAPTAPDTRADAEDLPEQGTDEEARTVSGSGLVDTFA